MTRTHLQHIYKIFILCVITPKILKDQSPARMQSRIKFRTRVNDGTTLQRDTYEMYLIPRHKNIAGPSTAGEIFSAF